MLGKIEGRRRRCQQRMRCLDRITNSMNMNLSKLQEIIKNREAWHDAVHGTTKSWTCLSNWTNVFIYFQNFIQYGLQGASQAVQVKKSTSQCRRHKRCEFDLWIWKSGVAICSSIFAWKILWTEKAGGLQSMGSCAYANTHTHTPSLQDPGYQATRNSGHGSWETKEVSLILSQCRCPEGFQDAVQSCRDLSSLTVPVNWGDNGWALETQMARVQILEYWEERAAQRNISEHLNAVSYL